jgi:hypothetical protein
VQSRSRTARRLGLENLESRQLMAGDVTVSVIAGDLTITGDGAANGIIMFQMGEGQYRIAGVNQGGMATRIRMGNSTASYQTVSGVTDDVVINMLGGNDKVTITHNPGYALYSTLPDDLTVRTGNGDDQVFLALLQVGDDVLVDLGGNRDNLTVRDVIVGRDDGALGHDLNVLGQGGTDFVSMSIDNGETIVRGDLTIDAGTSGDSDYVSLYDVHVFDDLEIRTYGGADGVSMDRCHMDDDLIVETGDGRDNVYVAETAADEIFARLGSGDRDFLQVEATSARQATFDGGIGTDDNLDLRDDDLFTNPPSIYGFELRQQFGA